MMVSRVYTDLQTHQVVCVDYVQLFAWQSILSKVVKKLIKQCVHILKIHHLVFWVFFHNDSKIY